MRGGRKECKKSETKVGRNERGSEGKIPGRYGGRKENVGRGGEGGKKS